MARYVRPDIPLRFADGSVLTRSQVEAEPALLDRFAGQRLFCSCIPAGVEMLVRQRFGRRFIANLPGRTHHHAVSCPYFSQDPVIDPLKRYSPYAVTRSGESLNVVVSPEPLEAQPFSHLTPSAGLELLWDRAGLNYWSPRMRGRRTYWVIRAALLAAAEDLILSDGPLAPVLYVPDRDVQRPHPDHKLVAGLVQRVAVSPHGVGFEFAHDRSGDLYWLDRRHWTPQLDALLGPVTAPALPADLRIWVLALLAYGATGRPHLESAGFLSVTHDGLSTHSAAESHTLQFLVESGRRFYKCPVLDARTDPAIPFVVLRDTAEPCYVFAPDPLRVPPPQPTHDHQAVYPPLVSGAR